MAGIVNETYSWKPTTIKGTTPENGVNIYVFDTTGANIVDENTVAGTIAEQNIESDSYSVTGTTTVSPTDNNPHKIRALKFGLDILEITSSITQATTPTYFVTDNTFVESNEATALSLLGNLTVAESPDRVTINTAVTVQELYDALYYRAINTPVFSFAEILSTGDGNGFALNYELVVSAALTGENKSISLPNTATVNAAVSDVAFSAPTLSANGAATQTADLDNLTGCSFTRGSNGHAVELTTATGSMTWDCVTSGYRTGTSASPVTPTSFGDEDIYVNVGSGTVTINVAVGATVPSIRSAGATVNVVAAGGSLQFTVNPNPSPNYEWRIYTVTAVGSLAGAVEVAGAENETNSTPSAYNHQFTSQAAAVQIISNDYEESITYYTLNSLAQTPLINLEIDNND